MSIAKRETKFLVLKIDDVRKYLNGQDQEYLGAILSKIEGRRLGEGRKVNNYWVINTDEPYAHIIAGTVLQGEELKLTRQLLTNSHPT